MSVSSFFGSLLAQFAQDLLFKRPITVELKRDANGFQAKASISPSGSSAPVVYAPYGGYPPPYPGYPPYGYPPPQYAPPPPPQQAGQPQPVSAHQNRVRPYILPREYRA